MRVDGNAKIRELGKETSRDDLKYSYGKGEEKQLSNNK